MVSHMPAPAVERKAPVAVNPRGFVLGVALALPLWGGMLLGAHALWTLFR